MRRDLRQVRSELERFPDRRKRHRRGLDRHQAFALYIRCVAGIAILDSAKATDEVRLATTVQSSTWLGQ